MTRVGEIEALYRKLPNLTPTYENCRLYFVQTVRQDHQFGYQTSFTIRNLEITVPSIIRVRQ